MYNFSLLRSASCWVATCMSSMDVHVRIFTDVLMACTFMFMGVISWSLFSGWLFWITSPLYTGLVYKACPILVNVQHDAL